MLSSNSTNSHQVHFAHLKLLIQKRVDQWVRRYIIDDDPYDQEAWSAALLQTQKGLQTEHFPKELY